MLVIYNLVKHLKGISIGYYKPIIYFRNVREVSEVLSRSKGKTFFKRINLKYVLHEIIYKKLHDTNMYLQKKPTRNFHTKTPFF